MFAGLKNIFEKAATSSAEQAVSYGTFSMSAPTWDDLAGVVAAKQAELGVVVDRTDFETGPASAQALKRTFGSTAPIRVKLYRDHAAWCPYCQKVWLQLEEKQIPYEIEKINMRCYGDKPATFMAKVPSGLLPVLELDGQVTTESTQIMSILEREFPDRPLLPPKSTPAYTRAQELMQLERQLFSAWLGWLTTDWAHEQRKQQFQAVIERVDRELGATQGPYFLGEELSLVDLAFTPFLERMAASLAYYKGYFIRGKGTFRNVEAWFAAMEARDTYAATRSDYYTHCHDLPPQLGGCAMHDEGEPIAAQIDGEHPESWRLPLPPLTATSLEPFSQGDNPPRDTLEAAARLVRNHEAVVRFAARGVGRPGARPVMAPLADPTAMPSDEALPHVDAALRHVAHALLTGVDDSRTAGTFTGASDGDSASGSLAAPSLAYLRDRVGVPRDLSFPAARQLRAHLNWFIDNVQTA